MKLKEISKQINALNRKKNFTEADHRKMSRLINERAKETSRQTGLDIVSLSYDEFKAFRERNKKA